MAGVGEYGAQKFRRCRPYAPAHPPLPPNSSKPAGDFFHERRLDRHDRRPARRPKLRLKFLHDGWAVVGFLNRKRGGAHCRTWALLPPRRTRGEFLIQRQHGIFFQRGASGSCKIPGSPRRDRFGLNQSDQLLRASGFPFARQENGRVRGTPRGRDTETGMDQKETARAGTGKSSKASPARPSGEANASLLCKSERQARCSRDGVGSYNSSSGRGQRVRSNRAGWWPRCRCCRRRRPAAIGIIFFQDGCGRYR